MPPPTPTAVVDYDARYESDAVYLSSDMSREERRRMKHQRREEKRREREKRRQEKLKESQSGKHSEVLGPLGTFLKSIIVANTYVD